MDMVDLPDAVWRKSSWSSGNGQCVEIAHLGELAAARDSKNPVGPVLRIDLPGLLSAIKAGYLNS